MRAAGKVLAVAAALCAAPAGAVDLPRLGDAVIGHPRVTYLELLRQVVPDLAEDAANKDVEGSLPKPPRHLAGKVYDGDPPDPVIAQSFLEARRITVGGKPRLVLLEDLGPDPDRAYDMALLALYDDAPKPKLLDVADVGIDRDSAFGDPAELALAPGEAALVTVSEHFNSNQTYDGWQIIQARGDHLRQIDQVFLISERNCGWERMEKPVFSTRPDPGRRYAEIVATVTETVTRNDEDCGDDAVPKAYTRIWRTVWRWNAPAGRYVDVAHGLDRLERRNEARM